MPQYIGFSSINACKPKSTNLQLNSVMDSGTGFMNVTGYGIPNGYGNNGQPLISGKKFTLTDIQLVIQDFINALSIPIGSKVGQPGYGTTLYSFIFEPNTRDLQQQLENEMRRVASLDPRLDLNIIKLYPSEHGILIEIQASVVPYNNPLTIGIFFDQQSKKASLSSL